MTTPNFAGPIASLPQYLAAQLEASWSGQLELVQQWQQQQHASQAYLQLLEQVLTSLLQLVQDHQLGQQQVSFHQGLLATLQGLPATHLLFLEGSPAVHDKYGTDESPIAGVITELAVHGADALRQPCHVVVGMPFPVCWEFHEEHSVSSVKQVWLSIQLQGAC